MILCPKCGQDTVYTTKYESTLKILKDREWYVCRLCDWECEDSKLSQELFTK